MECPYTYCTSRNGRAHYLAGQDEILLVVPFINNNHLMRLDPANGSLIGSRWTCKYHILLTKYIICLTGLSIILRHL